MATEDRKVVEPLRSVLSVTGWFVLVFLLFGAVSAVTGHGFSVGGFGVGAVDVCVTQPNADYGVPQPYPPGYPGVTAKPGATISLGSTLSACVSHPTLSQRLVYTLMGLPEAVGWGGVLFLLWRLTRTARRYGPFTAQAAARLRGLGWFIIIGSVVGASVQGYALDALLNSMLSAQDFMLSTQSDFGDAIPHPAVLFMPVLAGAVLLTFARFIRAGLVMADEIEGTV